MGLKEATRISVSTQRLLSNCSSVWQTRTKICEKETVTLDSAVYGDVKAATLDSTVYRDVKAGTLDSTVYSDLMGGNVRLQCTWQRETLQFTGT